MASLYNFTAFASDAQPPLFGELSAIFDALNDSDLLNTLSAYRWTGRKGHNLKALWYSYIASYYLNLSCTNDLIRHLQDNPTLAEFLGFDLSDFPSRWTFNRFWNRLSRHAEQVQNVIDSLTDNLAELLPGFGEMVTVDSTIVEAYSNPDKKTKEGIVSDPDASWTAKSYSKGTKRGEKPGKEGKKSKVSKDGEKEWFFGYKLHILGDAKWELPIKVNVSTAKENDSPHFMPLMRQARFRHSWFNPDVGIADAGYDGKDNYEGLYYEFGAIPIIDVRETPNEKAPTYNKNGVPYCIGRKLMEYVGTTEEGHIYRCTPEKCHLKDRQGVKYCEDVIAIDPMDDIRRVGPIARVSKEWKKLYSKRGSIERINSRLKETRRLNDFCFRRMRKVRMHCLLSVLTMQATAVAQAKAGELEGLRRCLRKVA